MIDVWTYWEGTRFPHIETCLQSMAYICERPVEFHLVTPENLGEYLKPGVLHPDYTNLPGGPRDRANCIRVALLATYGGWWWDADTIGLHSPLHLMLHYPDVDVLYMAWNREPRRILNGYIYMRPGCEEAQEWLQQVNYRVEHEAQDIIWAGLGEKLLTPLLTGRVGCEQIPLQTFLPIDIDATVETFFKSGDFRDYVQDYSVAYGLNHSYFLYRHQDQILADPATWEDSPLLIHQLLHYARTK